MRPLTECKKCGRISRRSTCHSCSGASGKGARVRHDKTCGYCREAFVGTALSRWCSAKCKRLWNDQTKSCRRCVTCKEDKTHASFRRGGTTKHNECNYCAKGGTPSRKMDLCKLCGGLSHRVTGPRCRVCGLIYEALPPVGAKAHLRSNWDSEGMQAQ